jgi:hypothetical protein
MIRYLKHNDIDKQRWDDCIDRSVNEIIYAHAWYLDIVSPGWSGLVEDDYISVFPLTSRRKFFVNYLFQPFFTQQLGLFTRTHLTEKLVDSFLQAIPNHFRFIEINLNSMNKVDPDHYTGKLRLNLELDLIEPYENLQLKYDQNTRRNIKKTVSSGLYIKRKIEPDELITLFRDNYGKKEGILRFSDYETLRKLMFYSLKHTFSVTMGVCTPDGKLCAGVFFMRDRLRWIFHFAASDIQARESGAMFFLVDSFIRENAGQALTLDFEGSNDPNVARFYKGFGAREIPYYQVRIDRLPAIAGKALYFKKRLHTR